jgi:NADPH-dependent glutamate synthase beta subunit-like oxidoreductase
MQNTIDDLHLSIEGFTYPDLFNPLKLAELHERFLQELKSENPEIAGRFDQYRRCRGAGMAPKEISERITETAPYLSVFIARMFGVGNEEMAMKQKAKREQIIFRFKKEYFVRRALRKYSREDTGKFDVALIDLRMSNLLRLCSHTEGSDRELAVAMMVTDMIDREKALSGGMTPELSAYCTNLVRRFSASPDLKAVIGPADADPSFKSFFPKILDIAGQWLALHYYRGDTEMGDWVSFRLPKDVDYQHLVDVHPAENGMHNGWIGPAEHYRRRDGFDLTDERFNGREVMNEIDYCIICHEREKDSCSHGFRDAGGYKQNPLGYPMKGCPLDQKISESHALQSGGDAIGALAVIAIDNPMCPGTGHRICNDCMKACIFQKQEPVNIPQVETGILTDVLKLPWGFEIYSLLTRWNPLNVERPFALPYNGKKILVVGMGPAGYTLAHYFLNEGFGVAGVDALKIEPLPEWLAGGDGISFKPVRDYDSICQKLSERVLLGFGGVSEYGITVRWDKNFLTVIYLNLLRREYFRIYDGVRFGGTITVEDAFELGFDHVAIAMGAGKPTFISLKNNLIRGIRKASDFLMSLQLTGASRRDTLANLQFRLPAVVIGGGLTAVDTATELMAYYPIQVLKIDERYRKLCEEFGQDAIDTMFNAEDHVILREFLDNAREIRCEHERAAAAGERPNTIPLIRRWGGVNLYYRRSMNDSPAYRLNHEEVIKALEEGIGFVEKMSPVEAIPDTTGADRKSTRLNSSHH